MNLPFLPFSFTILNTNPLAVILSTVLLTLLAYYYVIIPLLTSLHPTSYLPSPPAPAPQPKIHALSLSPKHTFTKRPVQTLTLLPSQGVAHDAHSGHFVQHLSRIKSPNTTPNLRQVHLLAYETLLALEIQPGEIGENITTCGIDLLALGRGTELRFVRRRGESEKGGDVSGPVARKGEGDGEEEEAEAPCVVVTGLRNPCHQIDRFRKGLQEEFIERDGVGRITARKAGIMGVVARGGEVEVGMSIVVSAPREFVPLDVV